MKNMLVFCFLLTTQFARSFELPSDTTSRTGRFRNFNIAFNWAEVGAAYNLPVKRFQDLPAEAKAYLNPQGKGESFGIFGVTFFYKHTFGVGVMYNYAGFLPSSNSYQEYLAVKYADYYPPKRQFANYNYSVEGLFFNLSYRKLFKYFFVESMFRVGFNAYDASGYGVQLKKKGANEYLRVSVYETYTGSRNSYQIHVNIAHRFRKILDMPFHFELGARGSFFTAPVNSVFTFEEQPYGGTVTSSSYAVDRWNPAFGWSAFINCYF